MCSICGCSGHSDTGHRHHHNDHSHARLVEVEQNLLSKNNHYADLNRQRFTREKVTAFNLVSSPGSGKTSLLTATISALKAQHGFAVIEGDQQSDLDAKRIQASGARAIQINTGKGCHLDAHMVGHALDELNLQAADIVMIENVGNLVCPAAFDLGEQARIVILSVTEGADKPLKYPDMFHSSALMIINKIDLLPYVDFDVEQCIEYARRIRPDIEVILISAKTGEGMTEWFNWLKTHSIK